MDKINAIEARLQFTNRVLLTFGLLRKPLVLCCEHCGKIVSSDMEWICGYCDAENHRTNMYSFLYKCEQCKQPPECLKCPHCKKIILLEKSTDLRHPARKIHDIELPTKEEPIGERRKRERAEHKAELEHEIVVTRLNAELVNLKKSIEKAMETEIEKSPDEILEEDFSEHDAHVMAAHRIVKRERAANKKKFADDPELLEMANESLQDWLEKQL